MITAGHLVDWIMTNRRNKCFRGWSREEVAQAVIDGLENKSLYYALTPDGKISGMILALTFHKTKTLFVAENLSMCLSTLKTFARMAKERFPGWKIEAYRHDRRRIYDTTKLYNKLTGS